MRRWFAPLVLAVTLSGCAVMEPILDWPMSFFTDDGEEVETTLGDAIADNADGVGGVVSNALGGVNPIVALLGGGAVATLLGAARRKKKAAALAAAEATAEEPKHKK